MRKFFAMIILLASMFPFCGCGLYRAYKEHRKQEIEGYKRNYIGAMLDLDLADSEIIEYWSDYGGMSDGNALTVFQMSKKALLQFYALIEAQDATEKEEEQVWHELPFSERWYDHVYREHGYFTDHRNNTNALPYVENGYWWTMNAYMEEENAEIYLGANFDFALFDADMGRLYYYEYDS